LKFVRLHSNDYAEQERLKEVIKDASQTEVVLTTYETVKSVKLSNSLKRIIWRSVILDEG
jgi:SNF2 family DNA or RNA helicase